MTVGFVVALKAEARSLSKTAVAPETCIRLSDSTLLRLAGMGPERARKNAEDLVNAGATALVSWGCAGALQESIPPGTLVLPDKILASDQTSLPVDLSWHKRLLQCLQQHMDVLSGTLIESPIVVSGPPEKAALFERSGALVVDMESAAIARVAAAADRSFLAVRTVSDSATMTLPVLDATDAFGRVRLLRLFTDLTRRPDLLPNLVRLGFAFRAAQATLKKVVRISGPRLLAP